MRAFAFSIVAGLLLLPHAGAAQTLGEVCIPNPDVPVRPGIVCSATDDFDYQLPYLGNAKKGDIILSANCGMVGDLLRHVSPPQRYSHSGIMVDNWTRLRHSTSSEERYARDANGDGLVPENLKYGWPGVITESIDEAYEGHYLIDPEGEAFLFRSFNPDTIACPVDVAAIYPSIVKPLEEQEQTLVPRSSQTVRQTLESIAEAAKAINGHYRFFAYTDADLLGRVQGPGSQADSDAPAWAKTNGPDATVCSQLIWNAAHAVGVQVEDSFVEAGDKPHASGAAKNGLYLYSEGERRTAGDWLYNEVYNKFYENDAVGWWGRLFTDAPDDAANQMTNCFAFDWCGSEPGMEFEGEPDSKDSERWKNPGQGTAVSPDNLTQWDAPPGGVYGLTENMAYNPGEYFRVHRWAASAGTGPVTVNVRFNNAPAAGAIVTLRGFHPTVTDSAGVARFIAIPQGSYQVDGMKEAVLNNVQQVVKGTNLITVAANTGATVTLTLTGAPAPIPPSTRQNRRVTVSGTVFIEDHENIGSNERRTHAFSASIALHPGLRSHTFPVFSFCTGGEVRVETTITVMLNATDRSVSAQVSSKMFEGDSCNTNEQEDAKNFGITAVENGSSSNGARLTNPYVFSEDQARVNVTVKNDPT